LILRLRVGAFLRLPTLEEQLRLHRAGAGAVESDEAGEPLDRPELGRVRGAAMLAGRWRCPLVQFATPAVAAFCAGLPGTASSGGGPLRLPDALRWTMDNALIGT
jgi:hypothetical protein